MTIIINKIPYRLLYKESIVLTDGTICLALIDHEKKELSVSTSGGRRSELEILDSLLHEATHALIRQSNTVVNANEGVIADWIGLYVSRLLYDNPDIFRPYLRLGNKKRALWPVQ